MKHIRTHIKHCHIPLGTFILRKDLLYETLQIYAGHCFLSIHHALAAAEYGWKVDNSNKSLLPIAMPADATPAPAPVLSLLCCMCSADEAC